MKLIFVILGRPFTFVVETVLIVALFIVKLTNVSISNLSHLSSRVQRSVIERSKLIPRFLHFGRNDTKYLSSRVQRSVMERSKKIRLPRLKPAYNLLPLLPLIIIVFVTYRWVQSLPSIVGLESPPSQTTRILDKNGVLLYQIYRDENRTIVRLADLPTHLINATLAIEDKNFYHHPGIDVVAIVRAALKNLKNCRFYTRACVQEGGSTLTQQLIKNTLLSPEKTIDRKLKEAVLAILVEQKYTKSQILEFYLNEVSYGGTAYGIEAASEYYFNKTAKDLTLAESALLAGLTTSPTNLSPLGSHPYLGKVRQVAVLTRMVEEGYITEEDKAVAVAESLTLRPKNISIAAPHFVMWIREQLVEEFGEDTVSQGGLTITTTLDLTVQRYLENSINQELARLKNMRVSNAAGLVTNPQTGEILAMVGSHDYYDWENDGQVNITTASRQPGSSIKPITYALALSKGLSPSSTIDDSPICFTTVGSPPYCPKNYDGKFHGTVSLRTALASSYNIPAVKLLNSLGVKNMIELGRSIGITTWDNPSRFGLSLTLGGGEIKMVDMAEVYGTFATGGIHVPLQSIISIKDSNGNILETSKAKKLESTSVLSPAVTFQINNILSDNSARSPAFGSNSILNIKGNQVAVKTGTTNNLRDNWTFGYTKDILVATWVGNNDNTPMSAIASGITGASPIWRYTIDKLLDPKNPNVFTPPEGTKKIALCRETKSIYCKDICPSPPVYEYFTAGTEPKGRCEQQSGTILPNGVKD